MSRLHAAAAAASLVMVAAAAAGCSSNASPADSSAPPSSASASSPGAAQLPAGWPAEVPPIPGFTLMAANGSDGTYTAQFTAPGDQSTAVKDYAVSLQNNGWAIDSQIPPGTNGMWGFRAFGMSLTMLSTNFGDQTVVSVNIQPV